MVRHRVRGLGIDSSTRCPPVFSSIARQFLVVCFVFEFHAEYCCHLSFVNDVVGAKLFIIIYFWERNRLQPKNFRKTEQQFTSLFTLHWYIHRVCMFFIKYATRYTDMYSSNMRFRYSNVAARTKLNAVHAVVGWCNMKIKMQSASAIYVHVIDAHKFQFGISNRTIHRRSTFYFP